VDNKLIHNCSNKLNNWKNIYKRESLIGYLQNNDIPMCNNEKGQQTWGKYLEVFSKYCKKFLNIFFNQFQHT